MKLLVAIAICSHVLFDMIDAFCSGGFKPNPNDCGSYFSCAAGGSWIQQPCPAGLEWNQAGSYCDWPANSGCSVGGISQGGDLPPAPPPPSRWPRPGPPPSSNDIISESEFQCAARTKGGNPDASYYNGFIDALPKAEITTKEEAAKFLAHACWETVGFQFTKENLCQTNLQQCINAYPNNQGGLPGKVYYGRGMLQVTWDYNYKAASQYLYGDDRLIQYPEQVADDPAIGWATAAWFWKVNVHSRASSFGPTLKAINGALECTGGTNGQNRELRFNHYKEVLNCLNLPIPPESDGACSAH